MVATGSQDATISLWLSSLERPVAVLHDCFSGAVSELLLLTETKFKVSDMAWNSQGTMLVSSSHDGAVSYMSIAVMRRADLCFRHRPSFRQWLLNFPCFN